MTTTMRSGVLGLASVGLALLAGAQEADPPERLVWTGENADPPAVELSERDVLDEILALELEARATRDFARFDRELAEVWKRATFGAHPERLAAVLRATEARSELLASRGELERALDVASRLWIDGGDLARYGWGRVEFRPATDAERAAEERSLAEGELGLARSRLRERRLQRGASAPAEDDAQGSDTVLRARIEHHLRRGQGNLIRELGPLAVEPLKELAVASAGEFIMALEEDPLTYLVDLVEVETVELCLAHIDDGGYFWRRRILRMLDEHGCGADASTKRVLEVCLGDPDLVPDVVSVLAGAPSKDMLTPAMHAGFLAAVADNSSDMRQHLDRLLDRYRTQPSAEGLIDALLLSPHAELARLGAGYALFREDLNPLRTLVAHPDPVLRATLAEALRTRSYHGFRDPIEPRLEPGDADRLARLAADPDPSVRLEAARTAVATAVEGPLAGRLDRAVWVELARDPSVDVRRELTQVRLEDPELLREVLFALAASPEPQVEDLLLGRCRVPTWGPNAPAYLATLEAVFARRDDWREPSSLQARERFSPALEAALGSALPETLAWVARTRDDWLTANALAILQVGNWRPWPLATAAPEDLAYVLAQAPRLAERAFDWTIRFNRSHLAGLATLEDAFEALERVHHDGGQRQRPLPVEALRLVAARDLPPETVAAALGALRSHWSPDLTPLLFAALRSPAWRDPGHATDGAEAAFSAVASDATALALVEDRAIPDDIAHDLVRLHTRKDAFSIELARAILARWLDDGDYRSAVGDALEAFGRFPAADDGGVLEREALGTSWYATRAIEALDRRRDPAAFPTLARCLRADGLPPGELRDQVRVTAAAALTNSLSDEAARILLAELEATDDDAFRAVLLESLQTIRTYQDEQATWRRRLAEKELRADAIRELLAILDGDDAVEIRAEAARALGTLGAIEALPRLVRLLRATHPVLREAARDALDRLNRPDPPPPANGTPDGDGTER